MLLWPASSTLIVEEHISTDVFNNFHAEEPLLLWVMGSFTCPEEHQAVVDVHSFVDLVSLNDRNTTAISTAIDLRNAVVEVGSVSGDVSVLTATEFNNNSHDMSVAFIDLVTNNSGSATIDRDGDECITVHTDRMPGDVLEAEKKLVSYLGALYTVKSGIKERELKVGGHMVTLQTFHYPALNIEAPRNKRQQTFVNKENIPLLFSYECKEAMTLSLRVEVPAVAGMKSKSGKKVELLIIIDNRDNYSIYTYE